MFEFAENTKDMTAAEILNYYRNLYYAEPQVTERGIVANAINDYFADVVPKSEVDKLKIEIEALKIANEKMYAANKEQQAEIDSFLESVDELQADKADVTYFKKQLIANAKSEVAREIFEEIEKEVLLSLPASSYIDAPRTTQNKIWNTIAELKKKYTGGE